MRGKWQGFRRKWFNSTRWRPSVYVSKRATLKHTRPHKESRICCFTLFSMEFWLHTLAVWRAALLHESLRIFWYINCARNSFHAYILFYGPPPQHIALWYHTHSLAFNHQGAMCRGNVGVEHLDMYFSSPLFVWILFNASRRFANLQTSLHFTDS